MSGMCTSLLVKKMQAVVSDSVTIVAIPIEEVLNVSQDADIVLLGPQISFKEKDLKEQITIPVVSIPMMMYGTMDVEGVLNIVRENLPNNGVL